MTRLRTALVDLQSLHNVGAVFRTSDGAGFSEVITAGFTGCPPDRRIAKVALGAEERLDHQHATTVDDLLEILADDFVICVEQDATSVAFGDYTALPDAAHTATNITLVMGNELLGVDARLMERADAVLEIPMRGAKESLNVSVAHGILAYHVAHLFFGASGDDLASRHERTRREGVLTRGRTSGPTAN